MILFGIRINKLRCVMLIGIILILCLVGQSQKVLNYFLITQDIIVDKPSSITSNIDVVLNPEWKIFKNSIFQFEYPSELRIDECKIEKRKNFSCRITNKEDLASINYVLTENSNLEELERAFLVSYTFEGMPCSRGGEIYSVREFINIFGFECKELKIKTVVECYSTNENAQIDKKGPQITEYYDKPSIYVVKTQQEGQETYFYLVPYWGKTMLKNEVLEQIIQSVQVN